MLVYVNRSQKVFDLNPNLENSPKGPKHSNKGPKCGLCKKNRAVLPNPTFIESSLLGPKNTHGQIAGLIVWKLETFLKLLFPGVVPCTNIWSVCFYMSSFLYWYSLSMPYSAKMYRYVSQESWMMVLKKIKSQDWLFESWKLFWNSYSPSVDFSSASLVFLAGVKLLIRLV